MVGPKIEVFDLRAFGLRRWGFHWTAVVGAGLVASSVFAQDSHSPSLGPSTVPGPPPEDADPAPIGTPSPTESNFGVPGTKSDSDAPQFFFDARSTGFSKDGGQKIFEGDVIAIGPRSLVTADKIIVDEKKKYLVAEGHVIILSNGQYITGDKVELWSDSGNVRVTSALLVVNDSTESERIAQEVLGYTASEVEFEALRKARLSEVNAKKEEVRKEALTRTKQGLNVTDEMVRDYARFLEQENLIATQENPAFAQMAEARRQTLRRRRDFWTQARLSDKVNTPAQKSAYFRLSGDSLERTNGNDLFARDGVWTPCHCEDDETPAWALRSSTVAAQPGGYATFQNAVLEIKGVPVLYFPWFRLPIKDKRQSGFLLPSTSSDSHSGTVYSQPLFLDLGPDKDVTLKSEIYEKRGTKMGMEARYLRKKHSGFQLNGEVMRDRVWMSQKANREELTDLYLDGLAAARTDSSGARQDSLSEYSGKDYAQRLVRLREFWAGNRPECVNGTPEQQKACEDQVRSEMRPPNNTTRGLLKWRGQERLSDRVSVISTGEMYSDRLYNTDLYVPDSIEAGFDSGNGERAIQPVRAQVHNDQSDYYLGLGSYGGDYVRLNDRFEGYQMPAVVKARSRWYHLMGTSIPVYASTSLDQYRIAKVSGERTDPEASAALLPSAWWRRWTASLAAPIFSQSAVQVDHFTDAEARHISFDGSAHIERSDKRIADSTIQSLKTGFRFQLPIDGKRPLPSWLGGSELSDADGTRYIQHVMNWSVTLAARPTVVRRGPYGQFDELLSDRQPQYFMATDALGGDDNIGREEYLEPYQLVTFATTHRWKLFSEAWHRKQPDSIDAKSEVTNNVLTWEERARRELLFTMDQPVKSGEDMFSEDQTKWFISRYQLLNTDYLEPVSFAANISYDYLKETKRREEEHTVANRPWSEAEGSIAFNAYAWTFSNSSRYNIYDKIATRHAMALTPPGVFRTNVSLGYTLDQSAVGEDANRNPVYKLIKERTVSVVTTLTAPVFATYAWSLKEEFGVRPLDRDKIGLTYVSKSDCWGLGFSRERGYGQKERDSTYLLTLSIIFMGQGRELPGMGGAFKKQIYDEADSA